MRTYGKRPELLRCLRLMCVCDGTPIESHQVSVLELLWQRPDDRTNHLLELRASPAEQLPWALSTPPAPPGTHADAEASGAAAADAVGSASSAAADGRADASAEDVTGSTAPGARRVGGAVREGAEAVSVLGSAEGRRARRTSTS